MNEAILVLDLGSTSIKSTLFTPGGQVLARADASYPTHAPHPTWAEQEPSHWWDATIRATRDALRLLDDGTHGRHTHSIVAVGLTGQMHGVVALNQAGAPLGPCLTVQDRRAASDVAAIEEQMGVGRSYAITGARLDPASPVAKLRWLARRQPEVMTQTALFLPPKDYLRFRLTGEIATDPIDAAGTLLYDLQAQAWSAEMAATAQIDASRLPPIRPADSLAGAITREAATALGLPAGIPVAIGAGDDVECLGAGLLTPGQALEHLGTTGSLLACSPHVVIDPAMRVDCYPHAVPGLYLVGGSTSSAGATLAWAARHLVTSANDEASGALRLSEDAVLDDEEMIVFLPYLAGERCPVWNPDGRGLLAGMTLGTTSRHIADAVFTGIAFSLRHILDTLLDLGLQVDDVIASGDTDVVAGAAWSALRSMIYGRPLLRPAAGDPTALGALMLTLVAIGLQPDVATAATRLIPPPARHVLAATSRRSEMERRYALYRELSAATTEVFSRWRAYSQ